MATGGGGGGGGGGGYLEKTFGVIPGQVITYSIGQTDQDTTVTIGSVTVTATKGGTGGTSGTSGGPGGVGGLPTTGDVNTQGYNGKSGLALHGIGGDGAPGIYSDTPDQGIGGTNGTNGTGTHGAGGGGGQISGNPGTGAPGQIQIWWWEPAFTDNTITPVSSYITSIQQVAVTIGSGATSATATISSVDTTKTALFYGGFDTASTGTNPALTLCRIELTNATTVTAFRNTTDTTAIISWVTVVQFSALAVNSVQYGTIAMGTTDATLTATITSVNTASAAVMYLGNICAKTTSGSGETRPSVTLTNATTVTATRGVTGTTLTVGFVVIEFQPGIIKSLQQFSSTLNSSSLTDTVSILQVVMANSIIINGGMNSAGTTFSNTQCMMQLTSPVAITFTRLGNATGDRIYQFTVVEFQPNVLSSMQRGTITFSSGASATATVTSTSTTSGICSQTGFEASGSATQYNQLFLGNALTNSTTITATRGVSVAIATGSAYELFTFY